MVPAQVKPKSKARIPSGVNAIFSHFTITFLLMVAPKNQCARAGKINKDTINAAIRANVLVNARGPNSLPSACCMVNTGIKLTMVVDTAVRMAEETSAAPLYMVVIIFWPGGFSLRCLMTFSERIIPRSTMVPMAMAIPERATILASTPKYRMAINTISTDMGNRPDIKNEALRLMTMTIMTRMVMMI